MLNALTITNFRGVRSGRIEGLAPLSVLIGRNNSGKSTLLEAMHIASGSGDVRPVFHVATRRGWCGLHALPRVFHAPGREAAIHGEAPVRFSLAPLQPKFVQHLPPKFSDGILLRADGAGFSSQLVIAPDGTASNLQILGGAQNSSAAPLVDVDSITQFGTLEGRFSDAMETTPEQVIDALMDRIDPAGPRLRILKSGDDFVLHTKTADQSLPVYFAGDGYKRLISMALVLASEAGRLVLLEEPEAFQHPAYIGEIARLIWAAVEQGTQVVLSTHSHDLLSQLYTAQGVDFDQSAVFKTRLAAGTLTAVKIPGPQAHKRLAELHEDMR